MKNLTFFAFFLMAFNAYSMELVCTGLKPSDNQKPIFVDCSKKSEVLSALASASKFIQDKRGFSKPMGACNTNFQSVLNWSDGAFNNVAMNSPSTMFATCNTELRQY